MDETYVRCFVTFLRTTCDPNHVPNGSHIFISMAIQRNKKERSHVNLEIEEIVFDFQPNRPIVQSIYI